jgi:hypothetical protein
LLLEKTNLIAIQLSWWARWRSAGWYLWGYHGRCSMLCLFLVESGKLEKADDVDEREKA